VRKELFAKTTAVTARVNGDNGPPPPRAIAPAARERRQMRDAHREQRTALDGNQTKRAGQEAQARAARLRKGVMGLWDRVSGKRGKVSELNARDMAAGRSRDRAEKQTLHETQMQERGELQGRIMQKREQHRRDRQDHRAQLGAMLSMSKDSVRDSFMDHAQELEDRKRNPPTAAQIRRDRAEKRGTMPEIVASERTRRADARADREARKTPVEGQEAGRGEKCAGERTGRYSPARGEARPCPVEGRGAGFRGGDGVDAITDAAATSRRDRRREGPASGPDRRRARTSRRSNRNATAAMTTATPGGRSNLDRPARTDGEKITRSAACRFLQGRRFPPCP